MVTFIERLFFHEASRLQSGLAPMDLTTAEPISRESEYLYRNSIAWIVFLPFTIFENIVCLLAIAMRRKWKSPDVLFFSIVFINLLTLLFPVTLYTIFIFVDAPWSQSLSACKFVVWCVISFRIVNVLQLAFLSLDRIWTLKWPGSYSVHNTANQNARTAALMWLFGISIGSVPLIGWESPVVTECSLVLDTAGLGYTVCVILLLVGSSSISVSCVVSIVIKLVHGDDIFASTGSKNVIPEIVVENETGQRQVNAHESRDLQNREVCIVVGWVVIVDVLINELPFTVFNFIALSNSGPGAWLQVTITWCNIIFCACVPLMLCTLSRRYRLGLRRVFRYIQFALGFGDLPQITTDHTVVHRQETVDSLDCYRPDDQDEPINFPEPLSQEVISFDDSGRSTDPQGTRGPSHPPEAEEKKKKKKKKKKSSSPGNTRQVHAETHVNESYVDDESEEARPKRAEMTSQEKRAHYHALGARRKKLFDARDMQQDLASQSKTKKKKGGDKRRKKSAKLNPTLLESALLQVASANGNGPVNSTVREIYPKQASAINRIQIPTENVTFLKAFSVDDNRLALVYNKSTLSERVFHSVEYAAESDENQEREMPSFSDSTSAEMVTDVPLGASSEYVDTPGDDDVTSGEARRAVGTGSAGDLYDIPEDSEDDLPDGNPETEERQRGAPTKFLSTYSDGAKPIDDPLEVSHNNTNVGANNAASESADGRPVRNNRKSAFSGQNDLEVPLLSEPKSPKVFVHPEFNEVLTYDEVQRSSLSRDKESKPRRGLKIKGLKKGKKRSNRSEQRKPRVDAFDLELQDMPDSKTTEERGIVPRQNGTASVNHEVEDHLTMNGYVNGTETKTTLGDNTLSAKDLRARFKETKTSKISVDNNKREPGDVISF